MKISPFGKLNNTNIELYTISNSDGMEVSLTNFGATITSIKIPTQNGKDEIVCGFDTLEGYFDPIYQSNAPYFGCTVGRVASVIKNARYAYSGDYIKLDANIGQDQLHGGTEGFDKKVWEATPAQNSVTFKLLSEDGDQGFPGNLKVTVTFTLTESNEIVIGYRANTDKITPVSLTNHSYFNLNGFRENIENHEVVIHAKEALQTQEDNAPVGKPFSIEGHYSDLTTKTKLEEVFAINQTGILQYYLFPDQTNTLKEVAEITVPELNRTLTVLSTEPGMLFYTGYYTDDRLKRENGNHFGSKRAFCVETHRLPDSVNSGLDPAIFLHPGDTWQSQTIFRFSF